MNVFIRSGVNAQDVSVIPNAVDAVKFRPKQSKTTFKFNNQQPSSHKITTTQQQSTINTEKKRLRIGKLPDEKDETKPITIVIGSRLVYR